MYRHVNREKWIKLTLMDIRPDFQTHLCRHNMSFTYRGLKTTSSLLFELSLQRQVFSLEDIKGYTL